MLPPKKAGIKRRPSKSRYQNRVGQCERDLSCVSVLFSGFRVLNIHPLEKTFLFYFLHYYCLFPITIYLPYIPLPPPPIPSAPPQSPHYCLCPRVLSFFLFFAHSLHLPPQAVSLLSIYESVFILLVSSVCSLDST